MNPRLHSVLVRSDQLHQRFPKIGFNAYRQFRYKELAAFVTSRRMVYLDMNFWIALRDPSEAREPRETAQLLDILTAGVTKGKLLCPVSHPVFVELLKQKGERRMAQAKLMDKLSLGIAIRNRFDVLEIELIRFFRRHTKETGGSFIDHVWAPVGHLIHEVFPVDDEIPFEVMERVRKVMLDVQWAKRVADLVGLDPPSFPRQAAEKINEERKLHPRAKKTFGRLFEEELHGLLDESGSHIDEVFRQMAIAHGIDPGTEEVPEAERRAMINIIRGSVVRGLDLEAIPSDRMEAALHATMRLDDSRQFKPNDLDDFGHAGVAASYCDFFFTEKPLAHMLNSPNVKKYSPPRAIVVSNMKSAIEVLSEVK